MTLFTCGREDLPNFENTKILQLYPFLILRYSTRMRCKNAPNCENATNTLTVTVTVSTEIHFWPLEFDWNILWIFLAFEEKRLTICFCCTFMAPSQSQVSLCVPSSWKWGSVKCCVPMCPLLVSQGISVWLIIVWCELAWVYTPMTLFCGKQVQLLLFSGSYLRATNLSQLTSHCPAGKNGNFVKISKNLSFLSQLMSDVILSDSKLNLIIYMAFFLL